MSKLADYCIYTIALPWRIVEASREGTSLKEGRRWVQGRRFLRMARRTGVELPVVFADSRDCSKLIAWSVITDIVVNASGTRYKIRGLWAVSRKRPQDLKRWNKDKQIAAGFIRPYALCHTPGFLTRAALSPSPYRYGVLQGTERRVNRHKRKRLDAKTALTRAWPAIVRECRSVLGSELHYQAMVYHCLRTHGRIPIDQLGMNVKMWIDGVRTPNFRARDRRHADGFKGGFEPIPDVVVFSRGVRGDWRRRKNEATLRHMIGAIEIKASERAGKGLTVKEVSEDIEKIAAHRAEKRYKHKRGFYAAIMVVDTAPESERMTDEEVSEVCGAGRANGVDVYYLSRAKAASPVK